MKSTLKFATPAQEQVPSSLDWEDNQLDDGIERIGRLRINELEDTSQSVPTQSIVQPKSSQQLGTS